MGTADSGYGYIRTSRRLQEGVPGMASPPRSCSSGEPACPWPTSTATSASPAPRVLKGARDDTSSTAALPARQGALRLRGQAVGGPERSPATPWRFINLGTKPGGNEGARVALRAPPKSALDGLIKVDPVKRLLTRRFRSRRCIYSTVPRPSGGRHHCP